MEEIIQIHDEYYIRAASSIVQERSRVLKQGDTFAIFDQHGDLRAKVFNDHGLYHQGTRFLSECRLRINNHPLLLLSSHVKEDNDLFVIDLTNPDLQGPEGQFVPKGTIHVTRGVFLWEACCYQRFSVQNYGLRTTVFRLSLEFLADFADIFEVRGMKRVKRGTLHDPQVSEGGIELSYCGLDNVERCTRVVIDAACGMLKARSFEVSVELAPKQTMPIDVRVECRIGQRPLHALEFNSARAELKKAYHDYRKDTCLIETSNGQMNDWINQSRADLDMLLSPTEFGWYPFAGIPWFSTIFGRDGLITALQTLWLYPNIARGVLQYLAAHQAQEVIAARDAEPGKILHEQRKGEMADTGEIPFGQYYGTIDATPLFIVLAGYYYERTADLEFIRSLWANIERALAWMDQYGDRDGDGFIEYGRQAQGGLANQGWKDSDDSISHADGCLAEPPIALCEVQGYAYEAKLRAAQLARALGRQTQAQYLEAQAEQLRTRFLKAFWCKGLQSYALALDGEKRPCQVRSSNAGHCLFSGIATAEHAQSLARTLLGSDFFTGWGIRTLAASEFRFNPMSYHNGSIWPHDNTLIAYGMSQYGLKEEVLKIFSGIFDASLFMESHRLPELYCGFDRGEQEGPTLYPVACDPQAWAAGAVFMLLQACLGLVIRADNQKIYFNQPVLPAFLQEVVLNNFRIGPSVLDIRLRRYDTQGVGVQILHKEGPVEVVATK